MLHCSIGAGRTGGRTVAISGGSLRILFIETVAFTRRIVRFGLETDLRRLQELLEHSPEAGDTDAGTGGLRKIRMGDSTRHRGKRGAHRVHYLHLPRAGVIYLVFVYAKNERSALDSDQKRALKSVADAIRTEWE